MRHGFADIHWSGFEWRVRCGCGAWQPDRDWHAHAHEYNVDPHGRHLDGGRCPCEPVCCETSSASSPGPDADPDAK